MTSVFAIVVERVGELSYFSIGIILSFGMYEGTSNSHKIDNL